jgi:hypothetical protein
MREFIKKHAANWSDATVAQDMLLKQARLLCPRDVRSVLLVALEHPIFCDEWTDFDYPSPFEGMQMDTSKYRLILVFGGWGRLARALAVPSVH